MVLVMAAVTMPANRPKPADFASNRLLATFPPELRDQLLESARLVSLDKGEVVIEHGEDARPPLRARSC